MAPAQETQIAPSQPDGEQPREQNGVVYTKPWVVDLILDLAGYRPTEDLVSALAIEPAAGDGAFLVAMARRLAESCRRHGRRSADARAAILAYELDEGSAESARRAVTEALVEMGAGRPEAESLAGSWVRCGDYLLDAPTLPAADYVIGNPPYIRLEQIPPDVASAYRSRYSTMRGRADLYVAFYEAALRQLKPGGVCAYICADRWMLNQYGAGLRALITAGYAVEAVVEMHAADAFEREVLAYPAITAIRTVSMIHPQAWENERKVVEITPPIPVTEWAQKTDWENERLETLPYDSLITEGRYAGGHVLMLHAEGTTQLWAAPPEVMLFLRGMLPDNQYYRLLDQTPSLADVAARQRVKPS